MNYYPHHIGDFDRATRHLTRIERSVYRDLIEVYYDTERPLTLDQKALCRLIIARSNEESTAVAQVLGEFFTETPTGWYHARCEEEIAHFRANKGQKAEAGRKSAAARALRKQQAIDGRSTPVEQTSNGAPTNQEPVTSNQEPVTKPKSAKAASSGYSPEFEMAWSLYPSRPGASKADSFKAWKARLAEGKTVEVLTQAVTNYAAYCKRMGTDPQYIKQPATFFGPGDHISADWTAPSLGRSGQRPSAHSGFSKVNYSEGIADDGSFS